MVLFFYIKMLLFSFKGEVSSIQHSVIISVSDLLQDRWFSPVSSTNTIDHYDQTEILLKVALNTITLTLTLISYTDDQMI